MPITDRLRSTLADRYAIDREIGAGGMATVYLARDVKHDREVALKVLRADLSAVLGTERFLSEIRIAAGLDHPHILTLIDSGEADGILFYVLPYVRGESLRAKLARERQLSVEEAVSITTQIAGALDYAHAKGVVHRDIKPENILLHEGEAVLADFGIALAVREASGTRMTETGLSLGTPQYMSPEQATGDRNIDKRSDVYSLAAVFYEMIAGEPPVTGVTAQAVIAKLMTEKPVKLRVIREAIPEDMDRATLKALSKVPADRFPSAGEYARALRAAPIVTRSANLFHSKWVAAAPLILTAAAAVWLGRGRLTGPPESGISVADRQQITFTGGASLPTITSDAKTVAYVVTNCGVNGCRYGVEMQDVGSTRSRRIFDGATALYGIKISPDRRNLLAFGTINGRFGSSIIPVLGGPTRYLAPGSAALWANGDSLVYGRQATEADSLWIVFGGLDGIGRDSNFISADDERLGNVIPVPGNRWFVATVWNGRLSRLVVLSRSGARVDETEPAEGLNLVGASADAVWGLAASRTAANPSLVRIPFNGQKGTLSSTHDTVYTGPLSGFDITDDGSAMVIGEGTSEHTLWALPFESALRGRFDSSAKVFQSTSTLAMRMARDGSYMLISRSPAPTADGREWALIPFGSRTETAIPGRHLNVSGIDSATLEFVDRIPAGLRVSRFDRRTGATNTILVLPDSDLVPVATTPAGAAAWIPQGLKSIRVSGRQGGAAKAFGIPPWYQFAFSLSLSNDARSVAITGWNLQYDSVIVSLLSPETGKARRLATMPGEGASAVWLDDGSILVSVQDTPESATFFTLTTAGRLQRLGSIPRPVLGHSGSRDLRRLIAITREYRGDAWLSKIVKRK